ncbi:MAG: hypothetical protein H7Z39_16325 [Burkholderiaceae bacterium]|nr:hypothetical protein [Burkholderiaceae bacterium]
MRVASKIEVSAFHRPEPLDLCLDIWMQWQRRNDMGLGWRGRAALYEGESAADSEQLYDNMDSNAAEAVEAVMGGLPRHLDWAIRRRCGIATVWRFPNLDFAQALAEAEGELKKKLKNNIATRNFFV